VIECETIAIIHGLKTLYTYLLHVPFVIETIHASLRFLLNAKDHAGRLAQWAMKVGEVRIMAIVAQSVDCHLRK